MKITRKIGALFLCLCIMAGVLLSAPITASAATEGIYTYSVSGGKATITKCSSSASGAITIPDTLGGYPVTKIGKAAFSGCENLINIIVPDSVTFIGNSAFAFCESLTNITIPDNVTTIGDNAFAYSTSLINIEVGAQNRYYSSLNGNLFNKNKTVLIWYAIGKTDISYTIPDSVTAIGDWAFESCGSLTSITIPNNVTIIGEGTFFRCESLTDVYYTGKEEEWNAISVGRDNEYLTNATIHFNCAPQDNERYYTYEVSDGQTTITDCDQSASGSITIPSTLGGYPVTAIGEGAFAFCHALTSITIPDGVTSIGEDAFYYCSRLTSVYIASSVTSIETQFPLCVSLTAINVDEANSVYCSIDGNLFSKNKQNCIKYAAGKEDSSYIVPDGVTSIAEYAFYDCDNLIFVTLPTSVKYIWEGAFAFCEHLSTVEIPNNVVYIGSRVFRDCPNLISINVDATNLYYSTKDGNLFNKEQTVLLAYACGKTETFYTIPNSVTRIKEDAFYRCRNLITVILPDNIECIDMSVFRESRITTIEIPDGVTTIGDFAFYGCDSLTAITIPDSVTTIGKYAFSYCFSLTTVTIGNSVTTIGNSTFEDCESLTDVYYTGTKEAWNKISIGSYNDPLKNATIHFNWVLQKTKAEITSVPIISGNTLSVPISITAVDNVSGQYYIALYNADNKLLGLKMADAVLTNGDALSETVTMDISGVSGEVRYAKLMLWDENFLPLTESCEVLCAS